MFDAMTTEEKREKRFQQWLEPGGVQFKSPDAERGYRERVGRFIKAFKLEKPDRVPVILPAGSFPVYYAGMTLKEAMRDLDGLYAAYCKFLNDFESDSFASPMMVPSAKAMEIIGTRNMKWPGGGLPDHATMLQFVEGEYMKADEYDLLLDDPSDYCLRRYLPRSLGSLAPFADFEPTQFILGMANKFLNPAMFPAVRAAYQAIIDYGEESARWMGKLMQFNNEALASGYPSLFGAQSHAPFDILADTMRGTKGVILDMFRQPEKLMAAIEKFTPMNIDCGVSGANRSGNPIVFFALHKGDETFMSNKQYEKYYWPSFRKVIIGLIEEGLTPFLFAEGRYGCRLEIIKDLPRGKVVWHFDRTDMFEAKKILGDNACIAGNVPASLLCTGTAKEVKEYCRKLIEVCGEGGGFILTGGASIDNGPAENLRAMTEAVMEYGS